MFSVWVTLEVRPEYRKEFLTAIESNAQASVRDEEGCHRFDVIEVGEVGSNCFAFYEIYRDEAAFEAEHMQTPHFLTYQKIAARAVVPGSQNIITGMLLHSVVATISKPI